MLTIATVLKSGGIYLAGAEDESAIGDAVDGFFWLECYRIDTMEITSRKEARALGLRRYFTGKPCPHGHVDARHTVDGGCVVCNRERVKAAQRTPAGVIKRRKRASALYERTREAGKEYRRQHYRKTKAAWLVRVARYKHRKWHSDPEFKIASLLRARLRFVLAGRARPESAIRLLGCTLDEARRYIERQFADGMSWTNHGVHGWHIDHKKPLASFNLLDAAQIAAAFHYSNLQPLWAKQNLEKGARHADGGDRAQVGGDI